MKSPREGTLKRAPSRGFLIRGKMLTGQSRRRLVNKRSRFQLTFIGTILTCAFVCSGQDPQKQKLDHEYQSAVSDYDGGRYAAAADQLERLLPYAPNSFEIHELLGLVYASLSEQAKSEQHLKTAVQLKPDSAVARTNLGTSLLHEGKTTLAGEQFLEALKLDPKSFDTNRNLGQYYIQTGKIGEAQPFLEQAQLIQPDSYENGYDLAMADLLLGRLSEARLVTQHILNTHDTGELHNLLGQIDEKDGKFLAAANDFESAAHLDPTEDNLFDWGSEMLLHRTYEPAIAIFQQASNRFRKSPRLHIGLGLALYSRGKYDEAVQALLTAADLDPSDPRCYVFLSKAYDSSPKQADDVIQHFRRYAELRPNDARAQYYYAMSLWKGKRAGDANVDLQTVQGLLQKSIALDDNLPEAHVQLGDLYAGQHQYDKSIPEYVRALELNPNLSDAHYRLGTDYVHVGQKDQAQKEFAVYQKLRAEHLSAIDKERAEVQQFVYSEKSDSSSKQ
jgi:tetratricopeptide (TPR) repeat protein